MSSFWQGFEKQAQSDKEAFVRSLARRAGKARHAVMDKLPAYLKKRKRLSEARSRLAKRDFRRASKGLPESGLGTNKFKTKPAPKVSDLNAQAVAKGGRKATPYQSEMGVKPRKSKKLDRQAGQAAAREDASRAAASAPKDRKVMGRSVANMPLASVPKGGKADKARKWLSDNRTGVAIGGGGVAGAGATKLMSEDSGPRY